VLTAISTSLLALALDTHKGSATIDRRREREKVAIIAPLADKFTLASCDLPVLIEQPFWQMTII
jgi:hypothetical protein